MTKELAGRHVAVLVTEGGDDVELVRPRQAVEDAGATTELLSIKEGEPRRVNPDDYDALILSGGGKNPGSAAMDFVRAFAGSGKPIGVLCRGPLTLVEAGVVRGRTLTSTSSGHKGNQLSAFCREIVAQFAEGRRRGS
jgi:protease I